jgi:O-acetyl-ADP-ribose deacetylase
VATIQLWHGDICDLEVDAIVNAASASLWMSSGVGGALKQRGGDTIEFEAVRQGPAEVGSAVVTSAGLLAARYVIHAVSLGADRRTSAEAIAAATRSALRAADELGCESVAFPALGTGVGGFPLDEGARILIEACHAELPACTSVSTVILALKGAATYQAFEAALAVAGIAAGPAT